MHLQVLVAMMAGSVMEVQGAAGCHTCCPWAAAAVRVLLRVLQPAPRLVGGWLRLHLSLDHWQRRGDL